MWYKMQCLQNMQLEIPDERAQKMLKLRKSFQVITPFVIQYQLKHSFLISCFIHSFWDFFSPQIKIKYFLSQMANKQNFQKLTACPSLFAPHSTHQKKTANRPIVNLTLTIEVLLSSAPYFSNITLFNLY